MPCIAALIILAFLSIFSAKYRSFAKQAFKCVFRRATFRPCEAGFDQKIKTTVSSWFLKKNEKIGGFIFRRFEILNWIFVILFFISAVYVGRSVYFYAKYGSCNPAKPETCIINGLKPASQQPECEENNGKNK